MMVDTETLHGTVESAWKVLREMDGKVRYEDPKVAEHIRCLLSLIEKAMCIEEGGEDEYSQRSYNSYGSYRSYDDGGIEPGRAYSMRRGRDSMGRYTSRVGDMMEALDEMLHNASNPQEREALEKLKRKMRQL